MPRRFSDRYFNDTTPVAPETFNPIIAEFDRAITALEEFKFVAEEQVALFNTNALKRFNDAIKPVVDQIRSAADGGFLVAQTNDSVAIVEGAEISFFIPVEARVAYRPTPFLAILAPDEREDWAIGRTIVYNDASGLLTVEILYLHGSGAERSGWTVAASSGVVEAVSQWLGEISSMRVEILAARDQVVDLAEQVNAAAILIAGGPVSTVNGKTGGIITLVKADIGLGNVDNTSDANKPVSTATATALGLKADASAVATALGLKADAAAVSSALALKSDVATTYSKTEADDAALEQICAFSLIT